MALNSPVKRALGPDQRAAVHLARNIICNTATEQIYGRGVLDKSCCDLYMNPEFEMAPHEAA